MNLNITRRTLGFLKSSDFTILLKETFDNQYFYVKIDSVVNNFWKYL